MVHLRWVGNWVNVLRLPNNFAALQHESKYRVSAEARKRFLLRCTILGVAF
jgi:hypothetical protein